MGVSGHEMYSTLFHNTRHQLHEEQAEDQEQEEQRKSKRLAMMINLAQEGVVGS